MIRSYSTKSSISVRIKSTSPNFLSNSSLLSCFWYKKNKNSAKFSFKYSIMSSALVELAIDEPTDEESDMDPDDDKLGLLEYFSLNNSSKQAQYFWSIMSWKRTVLLAMMQRRFKRIGHFPLDLEFKGAQLMVVRPVDCRGPLDSVRFASRVYIHIDQFQNAIWTRVGKTGFGIIFEQVDVGLEQAFGRDGQCVGALWQQVFARNQGTLGIEFLVTFNVNKAYLTIVFGVQFMVHSFVCDEIVEIKAVNEKPLGFADVGYDFEVDHDLHD
ncbi:hypothetical protein BpHYR1_031512 [Brachionus plicatilis]|uniref:Uncharacterized protein n=1 Tax=Brachionus plicatilis TaxID=10195 RepID=A0A3M7T1R3_BRAPC|nr:hypothetical protein BpHYR1_031512 [Brachionus plicatilis]